MLWRNHLFCLLPSGNKQPMLNTRQPGCFRMIFHICTTKFDDCVLHVINVMIMLILCETIIACFHLAILLNGLVNVKSYDLQNVGAQDEQPLAGWLIHIVHECLSFNSTTLDVPNGFQENRYVFGSYIISMDQNCTGKQLFPLQNIHIDYMACSISCPLTN